MLCDQNILNSHGNESDVASKIINNIFNGIPFDLNEEVLAFATSNRLLHLIPPNNRGDFLHKYRKALYQEHEILLKELISHGIATVLIKSRYGFLSNLDILTANRLATVKVLLCRGYFLASSSQHKDMLVKPSPEGLLRMHIHEQVAWNDVVYFERDLIIERTKNGRASYEDDFVIGMAHAFFEHTSITLGEVYTLVRMAQKNKLDWEYIKSRQKGISTGLLEVARILDAISAKTSDTSIPYCKVSNMFGGNLATPDITKQNFDFPYKFPSKVIKKALQEKISFDLKHSLSCGCGTFLKLLCRNPQRIMRNKIKSFFTARVVICFTGLDQTGKSTAMKLLAEKMSHSKIKYIYGRYMHRTFLNRGITYIARRKGLFPLYKHPESLYAKFWAFLTFLDYPFFVLWKFWLPLLTNKAIICDRYSYDMTMELIEILGGKLARVNKYFLKLTPQPIQTFLLDIPVWFLESENRLEDLNIERTNRIRTRLLEFGKRTEVTIIDGRQSRQAIQKQIIDILIAGNTGKKILQANIIRWDWTCDC